MLFIKRKQQKEAATKQRQCRANVHYSPSGHFWDGPKHIFFPKTYHFFFKKKIIKILDDFLIFFLKKKMSSGEGGQNDQHKLWVCDTPLCSELNSEHNDRYQWSPNSVFNGVENIF